MPPLSPSPRATKTIRVLVVDDSAFMRQAIVRMLANAADIQVVAQASNGLEAIQAAKKFEPDVITLDIEMPVMDGLTAVRHLKRQGTARIIIVSSLTTEGSHVTLQAMRFGADDFIAKDVSQVSLQIKGIERDLLAKVRALGEKPDAAAIAQTQQEAQRQQERLDLSAESFEAVLIGSSTGGPPVLETLIRQLPKSWSLPILIAQHMPATFTASLAERLNNLAPVSVVHVDQIMPIEPEHIYLAQGGKHMSIHRTALGKLQVAVSEQPTDLIFKPSVDELFRSAAQHFKGKCLAIMLTGMGQDGLEGTRQLHARGDTILAQDHASCVVYGMPKAITQAGLAQANLNPDAIAQVLAKIKQPKT